MSLGLLYLLFVVFPAIKSLGGIFTFIFVVSLIAGGIAIFGRVANTIDEDDRVDKLLATAKRIIIPALVISILGDFVIQLVPDNKQMLIMSGAYVATNSEELAKLPDNILQVANGYLEKLKEEVGKEVEKVTKEGVTTNE